MGQSGSLPRTLRLDVAYEGTRYSGLRDTAARALTVQEVLEEALARSLGEQIRVTAAGRTDAGVHASGQVVSFTTSGRLRPSEIVRAANAYLPEDVVVEAAAQMPPEFDARRTALRRHYRYLIWNARPAGPLAAPLELAGRRSAECRGDGRSGSTVAWSA